MLSTICYNVSTGWVTLFGLSPLNDVDKACSRSGLTKIAKELKKEAAFNGHKFNYMTKAGDYEIEVLLRKLSQKGKLSPVVVTPKN